MNTRTKRFCYRILVYISAQLVKFSTEKNTYVGSLERHAPFTLPDNFSF